MTKYILTIALFVVAACAWCQGKTGSVPTAKTLAVFPAKLLGFERGDYLHAVVKDLKGHTRSYFVMKGENAYFMATHRRARITIVVQRVDAYVDGSGQRMTIDQLVDARVGKLSAGSWWKAQLRHSSRAKLIEKYEKVLDKLVRKG